MNKLPKFQEEQHLAQSLRTKHAIEAYEKLSLGAQIKLLRKKAGLTQAGLARKLNTSQSALARMESGKQNFTIRILIQISFVLNKKLILKFQ